MMKKRKTIRLISLILSLILTFQIGACIVYAEEPMVTDTEDKTPTVTAVSEDESGRGRNYKTLNMSDGSKKRVIYSYPIHYETSSGWKEYDYRLSPDSVSGYKAEGEAFDIHFDAENAMVKLSDGAKHFSMDLVERSVQSRGRVEKTSKSRSSVVFPAAMPSADIQYDVAGDKIKESIILHSRAGVRGMYRYAIDATGYYLQSKPDGAIEVIDAQTKQPSFVIEAPFMYDAKGEQSYEIAVSLQQTGTDKYMLSILPDENWLMAADRVYPVVIDPTIGLVNWGDYFEWAQETGDDVYCTYDEPIIGKTVDDTYSAYLKMYLPNLYFDEETDLLFNDHIITNASFYLDAISSEDDAEDILCTVQQVTGAWDENITADTAPSVSSEVEGYLSLGSVKTVDLTELVRKWYADPTTNHGIYIAPEATETQNALYTVGWESCLEISYVYASGLEDFWTYSGGSYSDLGSLQVNHLNGRLTYGFDDYVSANQKSGVTISHVYNDSDFSPIYDEIGVNGNVGTGFKLNIQQYVFPVNYGSPAMFGVSAYAYLDGDGTVHQFVPVEGESYYEDESGLGLKLTVLPGLYDAYEIEAKDGSYYSFRDGILTAMVDANGNRVEITVQNKLPTSVLERLTDNTGRTTTLNWQNGNLASITFADGSVSTYTYAENGDLATATYNRRLNFAYTMGAQNPVKSGTGENVSVTFTYETVDGRRYLASVENGTEKTKAAIFHSVEGGKVYRMTLSEKTDAGQYVTRSTADFTYGGHSTTVTETGQSSSSSAVYTFNDLGQTVSISDSKGNSTYYEYGTLGKQKHHVTYDSGVHTSVSNYLQNSGFEKNDNSWSFTGGGRSTAQVKSGSYAAAAERVYQEFTVDRTGEYLLYADVNGSEAYSPVTAQITYFDGYDPVQVASQNVYAVGEFEQMFLSVSLQAGETYTADFSANCLFYIDNVQLLASSTLGEYNYIENGTFADGMTAWTVPSGCSGGTAVGGEYTVTGNPTTDYRAAQTVALSGAAKETYVFGGKALTDALPQSERGTMTAITATMHYTDDTTQEKTVSFIHDTDGNWQYVSGEITAEEAFEAITLTLHFDKNHGFAKMDDIFLYKGARGVSYTLDEDGNVLQYDADGKAMMTYTYNTDGTIATSYDPNTEYRRQYSYDGNGNLTRVVNLTTQEVEEYYQYDESGTITYEGETVTIGFDERGIPIEGTLFVECGVTYVQEHTTGQIYKVIDTDGETAEVEWDETTLTTTEVSNSYGFSLVYDYYVDGTGKNIDGLIREKTYSRNNTMLSRVGYSYTDGVLSGIERQNFRYATTTETISATETVFGSPVHIAKKLTTAMQSNSSDDQKLIATELYDADGNLVRVTYGNGGSEEYAYNDNGSLRKKRTGAGLTHYFYAADGSLVTEWHNDTVKKYEYDAKGNVSKYSAQYHPDDYINGYWSTYAYGGPENTLHRKQDSIAYIEEIYDNPPGQYILTNTEIYTDDTRTNYLLPRISYTYPMDTEEGKVIEQLTGVVLGETANLPLGTRMFYDARDYDNEEMGDEYYSRYTLNYSGASTPDIQYNYGYDALDHFMWITETKGSTVKNSWYFYDNAGQLQYVSDNEEYYLSPGEAREYYTYVSGSLEGQQGNMAAKYFGTNVTTFAYDPVYNDRLISSTTGGVTTQYQYDELGNLIFDGTYRYIWNGRKLVRVERDVYDAESDNTVTQTVQYYSYDSNGLLAQRYDGTAYDDYYYDGTDLVMVQLDVFGEDTGDYLYFAYSANGVEYMIHHHDNMDDKYWMMKNGQGDIVGLAKILPDESMQLVCTYEYSAFGEILGIYDAVGNAISPSADHIANLNPLRYRGYLYDQTTGWYYLQSRFYDPEICRFVSPDTILDTEYDYAGTNLYAYCYNDPVNYIDVSGESAVVICIIVGASVGALVGSAYGAHRASKNNLSPKDGLKYWKYVVGFGVVGAGVGALIGWGAGALIAKYGVATAATSITKGGGARFSSFNALKRSLGSAGKGKQWHHIVEQCQIQKSGFSKYWIHNSNNVINISNSVHSKISAYYNSVHNFTNGMRFRNWLSGQSFKTQYEWGIKVLRMYGVKI